MKKARLYVLLWTILQVFIDKTAQFISIFEANGAFHFFAVFKKDDGRDTYHLISARHRLVRINVHFADQYFVFKLLGYCFYCGSDHFTRATPIRPKINQNRYFRLAQDLLEIIIFDFNHIYTVQETIPFLKLFNCLYILNI